MAGSDDLAPLRVLVGLLDSLDAHGLVLDGLDQAALQVELEGAELALADCDPSAAARTDALRGKINGALLELEQRVAPRGQRADRRRQIGRVKAALRDPDAYARTLFPAHPEYRAIVAALARYRAVVASGGWERFTLEDRLRLDGWLGADDASDPQHVTQALSRFQEAYALEPSGVLDEPTRAVLAVPASERLRNLLIALERWRKSPTRLHRDYVRVNIPAFRLELWRNGALVYARRVVVGKPESPTVRADRRITHVQLHPPWYVPWDVRRTDLDVRAAADPTFLRRNGFREVGSGSSRMLVQPPGPDNWLGQVIFRWNGPDNIYIHDTPFTARFTRPSRAFSHGCVNADGAIRLAQDLLAWDGALDVPGFEAALARGRTTRVRLNQPFPAFLEYVTVTADDAGRVSFLSDLYGHDHAEMGHVAVPVVADRPHVPDRSL